MKKVEPFEYPIVKKYAKTGVIRLNFSFQKKEIHAKLTKMGNILWECKD